jgi:hypothetical protein
MLIITNIEIELLHRELLELFIRLTILGSITFCTFAFNSSKSVKG